MTLVDIGLWAGLVSTVGFGVALMIFGVLLYRLYF